MIASIPPSLLKNLSTVVESLGSSAIPCGPVQNCRGVPPASEEGVKAGYTPGEIWP
jgi:hypothetical protein